MQRTIEGETTTTGGTGETVTAFASVLTFPGCTGSTTTVLRVGTFEVHAISGGHGATFRSNGAEVTVEFSGFHCIFSTSNTDIGTLTGSGETASGMAKLDIMDRGRSMIH